MRRFTTIIALTMLAPLVGACQGTSALDLTPGPAGSTGASGGIGADVSAGGDTAASQADNQAGPSLAAVSSDARIQFAPVIGATEQALAPLSSRLSARARQRGLDLVSQTDEATLVVKGYFSTIADGGRTTVIYVWDVLDPSGNRLHRIQGQQAATGGQGTGWSSVTDATMETVADKTIDELATWLSRSTG